MEQEQQAQNEGAATTGAVEPRGQAAESQRAALSLLEEERAAHQSSGDQAAEAETLRRIGDLQRTGGKYDAAREAYAKARYLYQLLGDAEGAAVVLVLVGRMEAGLKRWEAAARSFSQAVDLYRRSLAHEAEADVLLSLGDCQLGLEQKDAARESFLAAARLFSSLDDAAGQAHASYRLGVLSGNDDTDRADEYLEFAESMYRHVAEQQPTTGRGVIPARIRDSRLVAPAVMAEFCARQRRIVRGEESPPEEDGGAPFEDSVAEISLTSTPPAPATRPWVIYAGIAAVVLGAIALLLPLLLGDGPAASSLSNFFSVGMLVYLGVAAFGAVAAITAARQVEITSPAILLGVGMGFAAIFFEIGRAMFPSLAPDATPAALSSVEEVPESVRRAVKEAPIFERQAVAAHKKGNVEAARQAFGQALANFEIARDIKGQVRVLLAQAEMEHESGEAAGELEAYRRAALLMQTTPEQEPEPVLEVLHKIIALAESLGDDERLLDAHTGLLRFKEQNNDRLGQSQEYLTLAEIYRRRGDYERAHEWFNRAHGVYQDLRDRQGQLSALLAMAEIEQFLGRRRQAYGSYYHAFVLYRELDDAEGQASMLLYMGAIDELSERWAEAAAAFRQAQRIYATRGDRAGEAKAAFRYGTVQAAHGNARQAREAFTESLGFFESSGDTSSQAGVLRGLARLEERDDHADAARIRYERALQLYRAASGEVSDMGELAVLLDLALLEQKAERADAALRAYADARQVVSRLTDQAQRARLLLGVADMGAKLGQEEEAQAMYNEAVSIFVEIGDTSGESTARDRLAAMGSTRGKAGI